MEQNPSDFKASAWLWWAICIGSALAIVVVVLSAVYGNRLLKAFEGSQPLALTGIVLVGLALVVGLMLLLLLYSKVAGVSDKDQPLGLPVGSIRALLAFCLVVVFISMGVFLYEGVSKPGETHQVKSQSESALADLKRNFANVVAVPMTAAELAANPCVSPSPAATRTERPAGATGSAAAAGAGSAGSGAPAGGAGQAVAQAAAQPCYVVTYSVVRSKEGDDLAKQMFTQLATVFVTVIGFYFGSSTAGAGVKAGVIAAGGPADKSGGSGTTGAGGGDVPGALQEAKALDHDADVDLKRAQTALKQPGGPEDKRAALEAAVQEAETARKAIAAKLEALKASAASFGTSTVDAENKAAATDVSKGRDDIKTLAGTVKAAADKAEALLKPDSTH